MEYWETTPYLKWYKSHRKFYILAHLFIEDFEDNKQIHLPTFTSFIKSLYCHSKGEEKMFNHVENIKNTFTEHNHINPTKSYTEEEKYILCKSLIIHMKEEDLNLQRCINSIIYIVKMEKYKYIIEYIHYTVSCVVL